jgi:NodT family efflux transporter outer membrane factor (OMF) lipoprotein
MNLIMKKLEMRAFSAVVCALLAAALAAGCKVGPNYQRPAAFGTNAMPAAFGELTSTNLGDWKPAEPSAHLPRGTWWELFGDAELNRLETLAAEGNQDLAAAFARLEQARALVKVVRADLFPQVTGAASYNRQRTSENSIAGKSSTFNTFYVPLSASWELDLWGRVRRSVEGAKARLTATADDLESTRLLVEAEVAIDYITIRGLEAQTKVLEETIQTYHRSLDLTENRHKSGIATDYDVSLAQTQLKSTEAQLPEVELQRATFRHALATLCGRPASGFAIAPASGAAAVLPAIPVSVPSALLESRPDIASAERRMAAANEDIGVAVAAFYPTVTLSGLAGFQSIDAGTLFNWPSRVWALGPSVQLPLFTGGRNRAQLASTRAAYDITVAEYRATVLGAFQEVEDQLAAQGLLSTELAAEQAALQAARRTLEISNLRYKGGVITYLDVAIAQGAALSHEQTVVQLTARRFGAAVSLIKALGAGWNTETASASGAQANAAQPAAEKPATVKQ